ncbi:hypothetical protein MTBPR1_40200 [Candidatus Terasakiella magnetica]|uniref:HTH cro/C1-type domain-containing protein n=1 Tax=Candidatus Terasakiella magnetica TaxID=1867952 RepID=A0A1C3RIT2_9PROT|nr:XRE family transcriptional regulator [Candidatus Terasakiella magnetica]SCA57177.1 hypothetical protein MTBPR1_40200 [Candidatus Terasakiella magnetica]
MSEIGQRFIEIRKNLGITQKEFAERLGVSLGTLQGYEYGKTPKGDILKKLSDWKYDLNWLVAGQGQMKRSHECSNAALDKIMIWNVAYFLCKREKLAKNPEVFADTFIEIFETMTQNISQDDEEVPQEPKEANVIDFTLRRLNAK